MVSLLQLPTELLKYTYIQCTKIGDLNLEFRTNALEEKKYNNIIDIVCACTV
jgi:hypothetical protein